MSWIRGGWHKSSMPKSTAGAVALILAIASSVGAQDRPNPVPPSTQQDDGTIRLRLPTVVVTAQKESEDIQEAPVSVTAVTKDTLENAGVRSVSEAAAYAPNTFFSEFTARKLSNPRMRGVGSSPNNPGVTTYIDGVPQLNANSSSIELVGVNQIEFVRGPQSALFGRNALGGLVSITSTRPSLTTWTGRVEGPFGNYGTADVRGNVSGPVTPDKLAISFGGGYSRREGFTVNDVTTHDLDSRSAGFGKAQLLWTPTSAWEVRGIFSGESARDGDYALQDLAAVRARPFHAARDFEGFTHRDMVLPTLHVTRTGSAVDVSSITGFVWWKTEDSTDLDYTPLPLVKRNNLERDHQFTEELRVSSAKNAKIVMSSGVSLKWQAGLFLFTQNYTQDAVNSFSPFVLSPQIRFPVDQHSPQSALDDHGVGVYGQGTFTVHDRLELVVGLRTDHESKSADLKTFFTPLIAPPSAVAPDRAFTDVSPQVTVAYHAAPRQTVYATASRGFKAGGFNAASPVGREAYGEEHSWNYEGGAKSSWHGDRLALNAVLFYLTWDDLQVNVPNPQVPAQFFIANAGSATSKGMEVEFNARAAAGVDLFSSVGYTNATFGNASVSNGVNVSGKRLSNTPEFTVNAGVQLSHAMSTAITLYGRAEVTGYGNYKFDDANTAEQEAYGLANFRVGARHSRFFVEGWAKNAFNTHYIVTAFAYPGLAPSGFIAESGAARTVGVRVGMTF